MQIGVIGTCVRSAGYGDSSASAIHDNQIVCPGDIHINGSALRVPGLQGWAIDNMKCLNHVLSSSPRSSQI